jgi:hypothetical protein
MGMSISRWVAIVGAICAAVSAILLPFPAAPSLAWIRAPMTSPALDAEMRKLTQAAVVARSAVRTYRVARALERWNEDRTTADTGAVRLDAIVPSHAATAVRAIVAEQWAALGPRASAAHAQVFVYVDGTTIPRASNAGDQSRALEGRALIDVTFALPDATDGAHCVALVRLRGSSPAHVAALRNQPLLGVCGFFAAFGLPGAGVRSWLATTHYRFARRSDWVVARAPAVDATALYALSDAGGRCLTGEAGGCLEALRVSDSSSPSGPTPAGIEVRVIDPSSPTYDGVANSRSAALGGAEDELLADAVRAIGPDRFARFWASSSRPDAAYLAASGVSLESWTQQWLTRTYGTVGQRPTVRLSEFMWLAIAMPFVLFVAARPRERILADRR